MESRKKISMLGIAIALWASVPEPVQAQQAVRRLELSTPRAFGYVIGDTIKHRIDLELVEPFYLDETSLPEAGQLSNRLELAAPVVRTESRSGATLYEIRLTYQTFYFPAQLESSYQSFTEADIGALRGAGFDAAFSDVGEGVGKYLDVLKTGP